MKTILIQDKSSWISKSIVMLNTKSIPQMNTMPRSIYLAWIISHGFVNNVIIAMMTSSNGDIFRVTGHLCGEFTGPQWISRTKASDAELWCFLSSASE